MQKSKCFSMVFTISVFMPFVIHGCEKIPSLKELCLQKLVKIDAMVVDAVTQPKIPAELQASLFAAAVAANANILLEPSIKSVAKKLAKIVSPKKRNNVFLRIKKLENRDTIISEAHRIKNINEWAIKARAVTAVGHTQQLLGIDNLESTFNNQRNETLKVIITLASQERMKLHSDQDPRQVKYTEDNLKKLEEEYLRHSNTIPSPVKRLFSVNTATQKPSKSRRRLTFD